MKLNKIMFLTIVLLAILSLGAVSAHDDLSDDISSVSHDDTIQLDSDGDSKLSDNSSEKAIYVGTEGDDSASGNESSPYATINKAISSVNASDDAVIYLGEGTFSGDNNTNLDINLAHVNYNGTLTIIGKGDGKTIIDANDEAPIFKAISADSIVTLINITFTHGKGSSGSAIYNSGFLTVDNCVFTDNEATSYGAIYHAANNDLVVMNSKFSNNVASAAADIYFARQNYLATIINNEFENSTSSSSYAYASSVRIEDGKSYVRNNTFKNMPVSNVAVLAARYNNDANIANITGNTFINCTCNSASTGIAFVQNAYLKNNKFVNCTADAGYIYINTDFNAYIAFEDVTADGASFVLTAKITDDMGNPVRNGNVNFLIDGVTVGSGNSNNGTVKLTVTKLYDNGTYEIDGFSSYSSWTPNQFDVTTQTGVLTVDFDHNPMDLWVSNDGDDENGSGNESAPFKTLKHALDYGFENSFDLTVHLKEGIYNGTQNRALSYSPTAKLTIIGESYGKAIIDAENTNTIFTFGKNTDVTLINMTLVNTTGRVISVYNMVVKDSIMKNVRNFYAQYSDAHVVFDNLTYINGGGIQIYNPEIYNSEFRDCNGLTSTGLLWLACNNGHIIRIENTKFINNTIAGSSGGAAFYIQGDAVLLNNDYINNNVTGNAKYIAYASSNQLTSINETFIGNNVPNVIAYYVGNQNNPTVIIENIVFENNTAAGDCAGLYTNGGIVNGAKFVNNTAGGNGGAIYLYYHSSSYDVPNLVLNDVVFENNKANNGNDIFIFTPTSTSYAYGKLEGMTVSFNDLTTNTLEDVVSVNVTHDSGAVIGGGSVTFYLNGSRIGVSDIINGVAVLDYIGFKKNGTFVLSGEYSLDNNDTVYNNATVVVALNPLKDNVTLYVSDSKGDDENGTGTLDNPYKTIQTALLNGYKQSSVIVIRVLEGNYSGELNTNLTVTSSLDISIIGDGPDKTLIDGRDLDWFLNILSGDGIVKVANMTIANITKNYVDARLYNQVPAISLEEGAIAVIDNVTFIRCHGTEGGAVYSRGILTVNNSYFFNNGDSNNGGAIKNYGTLTVYNSEFIANHAKYYSTIFNDGIMFIYDSIIEDSMRVNGWTGNAMAIGGAGNITMVNSTLSRSGKSALDIIGAGQTWADNPGFAISIGSTGIVKVIDSVIDGNDATYSAQYISNVAFGGAGSIGVFVPYGLEVVNTKILNLRDIISASKGTNYFDSCYIENVTYVSEGTSYDYNITVVNSYFADGTTMATKRATANVVLDSNWWGDNDEPTYTLGGVSTTPDNYLILTLEQSGDDVILAFKVFDGENITDYEGTLYPRDFTINATNAVLGVSNGTISNKVIIPVSVDAASYEIEATVDNQTVNLTVVRHESQIDIDAINSDLSINATLSDEEGNPIANATVTYSIGEIKDNLTTDENGKFSIPCFSNGDLLIEFAGNGANMAANKTFTYNGVIKQAVMPEIEIPAGVVVGDDANVVVSIENATGYIFVFVDDELSVLPLDENGVAIVSLENVTAGNHTIVVAYEGDENLYPTAINDVLYVAKIAPVVEASAEEIIEGAAAIVEITVDDDASGIVLVDVGGQKYYGEIDSGKASVSVSGLKAGNYTADVTYMGDDRYAEGSASATINVVAKKETDANITIPDIKAGENATVDVALPENATGNVSVKVDGEEIANVPVENGTASIPLGDLTAGNHVVEVAYTGDDNYAPVSETKDVTVAKLEANVTASANNITEGETAVIDIAVDGDATGVVLVDVDGQKYYGEIDSGKASVSVSGLKAGNYTITVAYPGDDKYANGSASVSVNVAEKPVADVNVTVPADIKAGENATVDVALPEDATGNVTVLVNGEETASVPVENGTASVPLTGLNTGANAVEVKYSGDDKYAPASSTSAINVDKKDTVITVDAKFSRVANDFNAGERGEFFYAILSDIDGNPLFNKTVQIAVNGPIYNVTTDEKGQAGLQVNLANANTYTYALSFQGDDEYNAAPLASSKLTVTKKTSSISASAKTYKVKATKSYSVTLKSGKNPYDGKTYLSAGKKITLKVNGKTYTAKTNSKGVAKFTLKLTKKGKYTAKISFSGDKTYKASSKSVKITVK